MKYDNHRQMCKNCLGEILSFICLAIFSHLFLVCIVRNYGMLEMNVYVTNCKHNSSYNIMF